MKKNLLYSAHTGRNFISIIESKSNLEVARLSVPQKASLNDVGAFSNSVIDSYMKMFGAIKGRLDDSD